MMRPGGASDLAARALTAVNFAGIAGAMLVQWGMGVIIELGRDAVGAYGIGAYRPAFLVTALVGVVAVGVYGVGSHASPGCASEIRPG